MANARTSRPKVLLAILLTGLFMANVDVAIANIATPAISLGLGATGAELQFVVSGYVVSYAMLLTTAARLQHARLRPDVCHRCRGVHRRIAGLRTRSDGGLVDCRAHRSGYWRSVHGGPGPERHSIELFGSRTSSCHRHVRGGAVRGGSRRPDPGWRAIAANLFGATWRPAFLINVPIGLILTIAAPRVLPMNRPVGTSVLDLKGVGCCLRACCSPWCHSLWVVTALARLGVAVPSL